MSQVSCTDSDKERFEQLKRSDETQSEAFERVLDMAEAFNGEIIDEEQLAEEVAEKMGPKIELSMYRVVNEMREKEVELEYHE